jgi:hypothetical protein
VAYVHVQHQDVAAGGDGDCIGPGRRRHRRKRSLRIGGGPTPTFKGRALIAGDHGDRRIAQRGQSFRCFKQIAACAKGLMRRLPRMRLFSALAGFSPGGRFCFAISDHDGSLRNSEGRQAPGLRV